MKVLVAEDDSTVRGLLGHMLGQDGHKVILTENGEQAWAEYRRSAPDVVIADWLMPGTDGLELCRRIRSHPANPYTYIVVLTGLASPEHALEAMQAGADDHLPKPFEMASIEAQLVAASRLTALHHELFDHGLSVLASQLETKTDADLPEVAVLADRLRLLEELNRLDARTRRYGHRYWLALVEIDRFQRLREAKGGAAANAIVERVVLCLRQHLRAGDAVYRFNADQLLVVLPEQDHVGATRAADRLRADVERLAIPHPHNLPKAVVTVSIGMAVHEQATGGDIGRALLTASQLVLAARHRGGDTAVSESSRI